MDITWKSKCTQQLDWVTHLIIVVQIWNSLSLEVVASETVVIFKNILYSVFENIFEID